MVYQATHLTRYSYEAPVSQCVSEARLTPRQLPGQKLIHSRVCVDPVPDVTERRVDYFGNEVVAVSIFHTHESFVTASSSIVDVSPVSRGPMPDISWEAARDHMIAHTEDESLVAYEFTFDSPYVTAEPELAAYAAPSFTPGRPLSEAVQELSHRIHKEFLYRPKATTIDMPLIQVLEKRQGVCQDFTHIMIGALRSLRLSARYVSGYLKSGSKYQGAEASHAWVSVYLPDYGWLDLDPTNDMIPGEGHITLALGRDYADVTPVKGIALGGGGQTVEVEVKVVPASAAAIQSALTSM
ncbi:MAG: transglutaminase family protein [Bryobacteraceae bacterium]|nr:transglutaminase family protein [Bryobacteraceae bacterium]